MDATLSSVTTVSPVDLMGKLKTSPRFSINPGTLIANRPCPVSIAPAAISELLLRTALNKSCCEIL